MPIINKTGAWIMIIKDMPFEFPVDRLSIFYAKPVDNYLRGCREQIASKELRERAMRINISLEAYSENVYKLLTGNKKEISSKWIRKEIEFDISRYGYSEDSFVSGVEIVTPFGAAKIWPEEYNEVSLDFALNAVQGESHIIRYLNNDGSVRGRMKRTSISDKLFYLRSRGIAFNESMKRISGEIKTQYLMYFDPLPQYIHTFSRSFVKRAKRKQAYCRENGFEELLHYEAYEDGTKVRFDLQDDLDHLQKQELVYKAKQKANLP